MKKTAVICVILLFLVGSGAAVVYRGQHRYDGHYMAVNPPENTGETVIQELHFEGDQVTLISGNVRQQVTYRIEGNTFTMITDFGNFSYEITINGEEIILDGVVYQKRSSSASRQGSRGASFLL